MFISPIQIKFRAQIQTVSLILKRCNFKVFEVQKSLSIFESSCKHFIQKMDKFWFLPFVLAFAQGYPQGYPYHGNFYPYPMPYPYQPFPQTYPVPHQQNQITQMSQFEQFDKQETATAEQLNFKQQADILTKEFNEKYTNLQKQNADPKILEQVHDEFIQQYGKSKKYF